MRNQDFYLDRYFWLCEPQDKENPGNGLPVGPSELEATAQFWQVGISDIRELFSLPSTVMAPNASGAIYTFTNDPNAALEFFVSKGWLSEQHALEITLALVENRDASFDKGT